MKNDNMDSIIAAAAAFSVVLMAPKIRIGNVDVIDLRDVDVSNLMLDVAHQMGWQVMYKFPVDSRFDVIRVTEVNRIILTYFPEFAVANRFFKAQLTPLLGEVSALFKRELKRERSQ